MSNSPAFQLQPELLSVRQSWFLHFRIRAQKGLMVSLKPLTQIQPKLSAAVFWTFSIHGVHWRVRTNIQKSRKKDSVHAELQHFRHKVSCGGIQLLRNSKKGGGSGFLEKNLVKCSRERRAMQRKGHRHLCLRQCEVPTINNWEHPSVLRCHLHFDVPKSSIHLQWKKAKNFKLKLCLLGRFSGSTSSSNKSSAITHKNIYIYLSTMSCLECKLH